MSHREIILASREGRLALESEFGGMGHDLINPVYIMKLQSKARLSFPGRPILCVWAFALCWAGNGAFGVRNISTLLPHVIVHITGI